MGVDAGDFDDDGDEDIIVGELPGQGADLYVNDGTGVFTDESARAGLRLRTLPSTGFGAAWLDYDNDGRLDLAARQRRGDAHRRSARARRASSRWRSGASCSAIPAARRSRTSARGPAAAFAGDDVGRGAAFGDVDNDGDTDVVVANANGPLRLLVNSVGSRSTGSGCA